MSIGFADSPLEGDGFEPSVPLHILTVYKDAARSSKSPTPISELAAGFVHLKACSTHAAEHVDANDRRSGRYTELTRDGGRGFASPFLHRRKADPTARPYPLPGTLTFFGTVFMAL